jgi:hypothetical protein
MCVCMHYECRSILVLHTVPVIISRVIYYFNLCIIYIAVSFIIGCNYDTLYSVA